jgi:ferredoxin
MNIISQLLFALLAGGSIWLFSKKAALLKRNVLLGRPETIATDTPTRLRNLLLLAFGQKKMFKNVPVAIMHFVIYAGFIIINIEVLEIVLDGLLGTHRLFAGWLGSGLYNVLINSFEVLALAVLAAAVIFWLRRNALKLQRFLSHDLNGWPRRDANIILYVEVVLMTLFLTMNAADTVLQTRGEAHYTAHAVGPWMVSSWLAPALSTLGTGTLVALERGAWWLHIAGIFAFLNYLPYSKHLHIIMAFPNAWFARPEVQGKMTNMPEIQREVLLAMGADTSPFAAVTALPEAAPAQFGAKDVADLSWKNLLDAYSCTECGRCSTACPASQTGKLLSPRSIMMKTRDRLDEVGKAAAANGGVVAPDGKSLLHDYISVEELRACTTCNACVEACPVSISPLDIILKQRRYLILDESNSPGEWNAMFGNIENNMAPWKFNPDEREAWVAEA